MKPVQQLLRLLTIILFFGFGQQASSQTLKDVFNKSDAPLTYLGIDFTNTRLLDIGNPDDIRNRLYGSINQLVIDEPKKYDINGALRRSNIVNDINAVNEKNLKANIGAILSTNPSDFNRLKESDINSTVKGLNISKKDGVGLLFVMEAMRKIEKKGDAAIWVTFIDMKTKKVLMTERIEVKAAGGFGFRNYWASTIKELIDEIDKPKYKEWQTKYGN
jgi:hypothetical protein